MHVVVQWILELFYLAELKGSFKRHINSAFKYKTVVLNVPL